MFEAHLAGELHMVGWQELHMVGWMRVWKRWINFYSVIAELQICFVSLRIKRHGKTGYFERKEVTYLSIFASLIYCNTPCPQKLPMRILLLLNPRAATKTGWLETHQLHPMMIGEHHKREPGHLHQLDGVHRLTTSFVVILGGSRATTSTT